MFICLKGFDKPVCIWQTDSDYGKLVNILDKEEFRVKLGQINKLVEAQDYKGAMQIVDSIDWRRVKNVDRKSVV